MKPYQSVHHKHIMICRLKTQVYINTCIFFVSEKLSFMFLEMFIIILNFFKF